jgi:hypothetical protein
VSSYEAEAVLAVDLSYGGCDLGEDWLSAGVEDALAQTLHVRGDAVHAVGVYAAEIGCDQAAGDDGGILRGDTVGFEDVFDEASCF